MPDAIHQIPLDAISPDAIARDRTHLDPDALGELKDSIARGGLRQPIEVFEFEEPHEGRSFGLISGFRRLRAFCELHALAGHERYAAIPAFIRKPESLAAVVAHMVEENDIRADLSPWEKGAVAVRAVRAGHFPDLTEALRALYPAASRQKRGRLRAVAELVEEMDGCLSEPERLSERECLRYAATVTAGFADLIERALDEAHAEGFDAQWTIIQSVIRESETFPDEHPVTDGRPNPRRIRRHYQAPRHRFAIRRERTRSGFVLHVTGRDATTPLVNEIFDEVERQFLPE